MLYGLILAGGKSSRMGHDKGLITFYNKPQREHLYELLELCCDQVFTSCKRPDAIPAYLNPLPDQYEMESPLNGILSAFNTAPHAAWLTVPVDMPFVELQTLKDLIAHRSNTHVATCFYDSDGKNPEPLLTVWEPQAAPLLLDFYTLGNNSPRKFLQQAEVKLVTITNANVLVNINSPEALQHFLNNRQSL